MNISNIFPYKKKNNNFLNLFTLSATLKITLLLLKN